MAKKKKDQKKPNPLKKWGMQESQKSILTQATKRYDDEVRIVQGYQRGQFMQYLEAIKKEIGIPDEINVRFVPESVSFIEVPPELKESNTTKDLTKVPG